MEKLTPAQAAAVVAAARHSGPERAAAQGDEFNESDYLAGVMTALFALDAQDQIPPFWILGVMSGRPVLLDETVHERIKTAQEERRTAASQLRDLRAARLLLETVAGLGTRCARFLGMEED